MKKITTKTTETITKIEISSDEIKEWIIEKCNLARDDIKNIEIYDNDLGTFIDDGIRVEIIRKECKEVDG